MRTLEEVYIDEQHLLDPRLNFGIIITSNGD